MNKRIASGLLFSLLSSSALGQDLSAAATAWKGGYAHTDVPIMRNGVRCTYQHTARPSSYHGRLIVGFWSPGCPGRTGGEFEFPVSRVRISKQGTTCNFECISGTPCLKTVPQGQLASSAGLFEAIPNTCNALISETSRVSSQAEAVLKAEEDRAAQAAAAVRAQSERTQVAAQEREARRKAAMLDCGQTPTINGGPWFSSTYKVAALDAARRSIGRFACVKSIEFLSDAPNPFGGKAAHVRFVGYDRAEYRALTEVRDFPY